MAVRVGVGFVAAISCELAVMSLGLFGRKVLAYLLPFDEAAAVCDVEVAYQDRVAFDGITQSLAAANLKPTLQ